MGIDFNFWNGIQPPIPSLPSAPSPRPCLGQNHKVLDFSKSQESLKISHTFLECPKCSNNHLGVCLVSKKGCFRYGLTGHRIRVFLLVRCINRDNKA